MMKFVFVFATLALAVASAASGRYKVDISEPSQINGQVVKPGTYTLELTDNNHAVLKHGKTTIETEARVENADKKFSETSIRYSSGEPNSTIDEIRISGTTTKVVFSKGQASGN